LEARFLQPYSCTANKLKVNVKKHIGSPSILSVTAEKVKLFEKKTEKFSYLRKFLQPDDADWRYLHFQQKDLKRTFKISTQTLPCSASLTCLFNSEVV